MFSLSVFDKNDPHCTNWEEYKLRVRGENKAREKEREHNGNIWDLKIYWSVRFLFEV